MWLVLQQKFHVARVTTPSDFGIFSLLFWIGTGVGNEKPTPIMPGQTTGGQAGSIIGLIILFGEAFRFSQT